MSKSLKQIKQEKNGLFKTMVYICAPFGGEIEENKKRAIQLGKLAYKQGNMPVVPHVQYPFMNDANPIDRENAMLFDLILMGKCQEVWVLGDIVTEGMVKELEVATKRRQKI